MGRWPEGERPEWRQWGCRLLIFLEASTVGPADGCSVGLWEKAAPERRLGICGLLTVGVSGQVVTHV